MIPRDIENAIVQKFFKGKVIIIIGPRQVGKTTLVKEMMKKTKKSFLWLNGDESDVRELISGANSERLKAIIGKNEIIVIDEAQRIFNIGITLKLVVDNIPGIQMIVTGSSALELANEIKEPLTGRKYEFFLYPLSFSELVAEKDLIHELRLVEHRMIYGYYPEIVTTPGEEKNILRLLSDSYLYKDILKLGIIKKPPLLEKILQALALQLGNEVSYTEIGQLVGADNATIEKYIDLLEKAYVVFKLPSLSRNLRNEIKRGKKIYFYDNGIRNAIIKNFAPLNLRQDLGALWENFLICERMKYNQRKGKWINSFFWRTHAQQEIDYIEEYDGNLFGFEFKWNPNKKVNIPKTFLNAYPESEVEVITKENLEKFIL